ncbi:hypothetical protein [Paludibacterium purpuratum]|uniref:Uncharacterized protein n=1 Tax=Paludibacterium purpuratum TaxID=1144873 RepID=A0A4V3DUS5_9NEIS|nr:hypothetical protein [Paludibacterium purpuratum]TDR76637.1 hypothetical protein DFP86_11063 [Paludibacterium purpuratum]
MIEPLNTPPASAPSSAHDTPWQDNPNLGSVYILLEKLMAHFLELFKTNKEMESLLRVSQIELNGASFQQKLEAADKTCEATRSRAFAGMGAGVLGMGGGILGAGMSAGPKSLRNAAQQVSPTLQSTGEFMKQSSAAATAEQDRQSQQLLAQAEYQGKMADQSHGEMRMSEEDAKQILQALHRTQHTLVDLLSQVGSAVKLS